MRLLNFWRDQEGATAAEFAVVVPVLGALTIGAIQLSVLVYANSKLQFAVDDAARCASVKTTICSSPSTTQSHASTAFAMANMSASFTATTPACGNQVVGTATYQINALITTVPVSLSATSCFPVQD
jgi:Flp pilus assembly protein TadG